LRVEKPQARSGLAVDSAVIGFRFSRSIIGPRCGNERMTARINIAQQMRRKSAGLGSVIGTNLFISFWQFQFWRGALHASRHMLNSVPSGSPAASRFGSPLVFELA